MPPYFWPPYSLTLDFSTPIMIQVLAGEQYALLAICGYLRKKGAPVESEALNGEDQL
jgi:hypothetical protein